MLHDGTRAPHARNFCGQDHLSDPDEGMRQCPAQSGAGTASRLLPTLLAGSPLADVWLLKRACVCAPHWHTACPCLNTRDTDDVQCRWTKLYRGRLPNEGYRHFRGQITRFISLSVIAGCARGGGMMVSRLRLVTAHIDEGSLAALKAFRLESARIKEIPDGS